jgi:hypothetical protein
VRLQRCPHCDGLSYYHPGETDGFLRYLEGPGSDRETVIALRRQEQAAVHELASLERELVTHRRQREAESQRGRGTRRLLGLTMLVLACAAAILLFAPTPAREDYLVLTVLLCLVSLTLMMLIILSANQRAIVFHQSLLEEEVRHGRTKCAEMKKQIDLAVTGTSGMRGRPSRMNGE